MRQQGLADFRWLLILAWFVNFGGCKHATIAPPIASLGSPAASRASKHPVTPSAAAEKTPAPVPMPDLAAERLPEGYGKSFGGWAAAVNCPIAHDCAAPPSTLPLNLTVASYLTTRNGNGPVQAGETVHVRSRISIIAGKGSRPEDVVEGLVLSAQGQESGRLAKGINPNGGPGEFQTDFQLEIPRNALPGRYSVTTTLFVSKRAAGTHTLTFDVQRGSSGNTPLR